MSHLTCVGLFSATVTFHGSPVRLVGRDCEVGRGVPDRVGVRVVTAVVHRPHQQDLVGSHHLCVRQKLTALLIEQNLFVFRLREFRRDGRLLHSRNEHENVGDPLVVLVDDQFAGRHFLGADRLLDVLGFVRGWDVSLQDELTSQAAPRLSLDR